MDITDYRVLGETGKEFFWFVGKQELIASLLNEFNVRDAKIIDIGCGTGTALFQNFGKCYGADPCLDALKIAKNKINSNLFCADGSALPFKTNTFDVVILSDVLEHIKDDVAAISEIKKILKKNGLLVLTVPAIPWLFSAHDHALGHYRRYSMKMLKQVISSTDLKIRKTGYWNSTLLPLMLVHRLSKRKSSYKTIDENKKMPGFLNKLLLSTLRFENNLIKNNICPPLGLTIFAVLQK